MPKKEDVKKIVNETVKDENVTAAKEAAAPEQSSIFWIPVIRPRALTSLQPVRIHTAWR